MVEMGLLDKPQVIEKKSDFDLNWLDEQPETVLFYGGPKVGKTQAWMSIIDEELKKDPTKKFYIVNTDGGVQRTFKSYFKERYEEVSKSVVYKLVLNIRQMPAVIEELKRVVTKKDWICFDLISDFYDMAQYEVEELMANGDLMNYLIQAAKDPSKFGTLNSKDWQKVKLIDNRAALDLLKQPPCNIVGIASEKDMEVAEKIAGGKIDEDLGMYRLVMSKPAGQKTIGHRFNTIIYIQGTNTKQYVLIAERGNKNTGKNVPYGENLWKKFLEERR